MQKVWSSHKLLFQVSIALFLISPFAWSQTTTPSSTTSSGGQPVGLSSTNATISSGATKQTDQTTQRQYVTDLRIKAREDSIRLLRAQTEDNTTVSQRLKVFGADIFSNKSLEFVPITNIATPKGYILGPGDELVINLYGELFKDISIQKRITPDGIVQIDQVGPVFLSGMTIEAATQRLRTKLAHIYPIGRGMDMSVRVGDIRSIRVNFIGEIVNLGTYTVPSLMTLMNALYFSGGPTASGSFRTINLIRRNHAGRDTLIRTVDLYEYITKGLRLSDISLKDDDVIQVPPYKTRIELGSGTKKTGYFELLPGENLGNLIEYAGGFVENAYLSVITIVRLTSNGLKYLDVRLEDINTFEVKNGDKVFIGTIPERDDNIVSISGSVYLPNAYPFESNRTVKALLQRAEGTTKEAFLGRAILYRRKDDMTEKTIPLNLSRIMSGQDPDVELEKQDRLVINSVKQLREGLVVRILGEVNNNLMDENNGYFPWYDSMTVEDLILLAGNLQPGASPNHIEVVRPKHLESDDPKQINSSLAETFTFGISKDLRLTEQASKFTLKPHDIVYVRTSPNFENNQSVKIEGEVLYQGEFSLIDRDERISDLVKRAGGLTAYAYVDGASLIRVTKLSKAEIQQQQKTIAQLSDDSKKSSVQADFITDGKEEAIGIDLKKILQKPHTEIDLVLQDGDLLSVPKHNPTIKIEGEVQLPTTTRYTKGVGVGEYISRAGGFTSRSVKRRTYVVYANGFAKKTKRFLFFNSYPEVKPGSRIVVPVRTVSDISAQQVVTILGQVGATLSGVLTVIVLIRAFN
ncbi:MAG: polysaccharide biosynthesis/export family protein [Siphonobacter sp.]